jgi:UDP-N-acetylglucosamine acyltransferase
VNRVNVIREIDPSAKVSPQARVGPFCTIGPDVTIGPGTVLESRVSVRGCTAIGSGNHFAEGCVLGEFPQDLKYRGGRTLLGIGHRNRFGRRVTAHVGTEVGGYLTRVGDDNVIGDGSHIAHDCYVDNHVTFEPNVLLAGHVRVQTGAVLEHAAAAHHFVTVGRYSRVGTCTPVRRDVPPFTDYRATGPDGAFGVYGPHDAGIAAAGLTPQGAKELRLALLELFGQEAALQTRIEQLVELGVDGEVAALCEFLQQSLRGVYGRYRELFRGKLPPEALEHLPPEVCQMARRALV